MPHVLYGLLPLSETLSAAALAHAGRGGDRTRPCRGPHPHPVWWIGPLSPDPDAGHCRHSRRARRTAPAGQRGMAGDGGRCLPRAADGEGPRPSWPASSRAIASAMCGPGKCGWQPAGRSAPGRRARPSLRPGVLRACCWRRSVAGCVSGSNAGSTRCWRAVSWPKRALYSTDNPDPHWPGLKAHGAPELFRHFRGELSLADARRIAIDHTRQYAKRQMTWFRHQMALDLVLAPEADQSLAAAEKYLDNSGV